MTLALEQQATWDSTTLHTLNARFHDAPPEDLLAWAATTFGDRAVLTCSFGGSAGMILLDMIVRH